LISKKKEYRIIPEEWGCEGVSVDVSEGEEYRV
jgi:hypothetical protein